MKITLHSIGTPCLSPCPASIGTSCLSPCPASIGTFNNYLYDLRYQNYVSLLSQRSNCLVLEIHTHHYPQGVPPRGFDRQFSLASCPPFETFLDLLKCSGRSSPEVACWTSDHRLPMAEQVGCGTHCLLLSPGVREVVGSLPGRGNSKESCSSCQETGKIFSPEMPLLYSKF